MHFEVDVPDPHHPLKNLTRICILADLTLILAWSYEEAGKIIETYKIYEKKPADKIMERSETSPYLQVGIIFYIVLLYHFFNIKYRNSIFLI